MKTKRLNSQTFSVSGPSEAINNLTEYCKKAGTTRSDYIRKLIIADMNEKGEPKAVIEMMKRKEQIDTVRESLFLHNFIKRLRPIVISHYQAFGKVDMKVVSSLIRATEEHYKGMSSKGKELNKENMKWIKSLTNFNNIQEFLQRNSRAAMRLLQ